MTRQAAPSSIKLSDSDLLRVWEAGAVQHPLDRALTILAAAEPDSQRSGLARLPVGRRDERLFAVYEGTFGSSIAGLGQCPNCEERVEFSLKVRDLLPAAGGTVREDPLTVASGGYRVTFRLPDSYDLAAIVGLSDPEEARGRLLGSCILSSTLEGNEIGLEEVPEAVIARVTEEMADADPLAEVELALACPGCETEWPLAFDIQSFLWRKIEERAGRLLHEVHALAFAYGWREADILALTDLRRQAYLERIG